MVKIRCQNFGHVGNFEGNFSEKNSNIEGGYYDPPFKCRVPNREKKCLEAYSPKGLALATSWRHFGDILGDIFKKMRFLLQFMHSSANIGFVTKRRRAT